VETALAIIVGNSSGYTAPLYSNADLARMTAVQLAAPQQSSYGSSRGTITVRAEEVTGDSPLLH
jgi:hypothetical protein